MIPLYDKYPNGRVTIAARAARMIIRTFRSFFIPYPSNAPSAAAPLKPPTVGRRLERSTEVIRVLLPFPPDDCESNLSIQIPIHTMVS
ncbi:MAG: hypothetical protein ABSA92_02580 [Candidatus Bathyarchaeia archaeon]|jgi:hypothetical protein